MSKFKQVTMPIVLLLAGLLLMACQPAATPTAAPEASSGITHETRSLEEVSTGRLPQIVDITDTDAVLIFESNIPLACSVVYGKTTDYGQIAVDQDMGGGAHTDHHPRLLGLEPDTEYHYRVQGAAADGCPSAKREPTIPAILQVVVDCESEERQRAVFERLTSEGWKCRVLTL